MARIGRSFPSRPLVLRSGIRFPANRAIVEIAPDTGWSWFNDPHIVLQSQGGKRWMHVGGIEGTSGDVRVDSYDLDTGQVVGAVLHAALQLDDHDPASLLVMPDGTLLATYSQHGITPIYFRRTTNANDPTSWGTETSTAPNVGGTAVTYPKLVRFASNGRIYVFFRAGGNSQAFVYSDDDAATWSAGVNFLVGVSTHRPYLNVAYDAVGDRLDIIYTDGHPRDIQNSQWHISFDGNSDTRTSNGTLIRNVIASGTIAVADGTKIYQGDGTSGRSWGWNVCRDPVDNTKIHAVFTRFAGDSEFDHRYCYGQWNGTTWTLNTDILGGTAGWSIFGTAGFDDSYLAGISEGHYSAGMHLLKRDPRSIFLSRLTARGYPGEAVTDIPNTFLHMDETSGATALDTILGNDGTYVNTPTLGVPGALAEGTAVEFVAANSEELTVPAPVLSTNGTIEFWFKWTAGTSLMRDHTFLAQAWIVGFDNGGTFAVRIGDSTTRSTSATTASVRDGNWHHLVVSKAGAQLDVYVDNASVLSISGVGNAASVAPWHVARNGDGGAYTDCVIDGLAIYPTTLSATRVAVHYAARMVADEWRLEKWTRGNSDMNFTGVVVEGGTGTKRLRPVSPDRPGVVNGGAPEVVWMVGAYKTYGTYATTARALLAGPPQLFGVAAGTGSATGTLTASGAAPLAGTAAGVGSATGALTTTPQLSGTAAGAGTVTGALTATALLSGTAAGIGAATGNLTAASLLSGTAAGIGTVTGSLTAASLLTGTASGVGTATGDLTASGVASLSGTAAGVGSSTGAPTASPQLSGTAAGTTTATGSLTATALLSGTTAGTGTATGNLTVPGAALLSGTADGVGAATGTLTASALLTGQAAGAGTATGTLLAPPALSGTATGTGAATGSLTASPRLSGTAAGAGTATGALSATALLSGTAAGTSTATGNLTAAPQLSGTAAGSGTATGNLTVPGASLLSGTTTGIGSAAGSLTAPSLLTGNATGLGTTTGALTATPVLTGTATGTGTVTGLLTIVPAITPLTARLEGTSTITFIEGGSFLNAAIESALTLTTIE